MGNSRPSSVPNTSSFLHHDLMFTEVYLTNLRNCGSHSPFLLVCSCPLVCAHRHLRLVTSAGTHELWWVYSWEYSWVQPLVGQSLLLRRVSTDLSATICNLKYSLRVLAKHALFLSWVLQPSQLAQNLIFLEQPAAVPYRSRSQKLWTYISNKSWDMCSLSAAWVPPARKHLKIWLYRDLPPPHYQIGSVSGFQLSWTFRVLSQIRLKIMDVCSK
jgi:hypothetical protein